MSEISFNFKIESDENLSENQVIGEIKNYVEREFNRVVFFEKQFSLIVKSKLLNPVIKFKGDIDLKVKDKKSKITGYVVFEADKILENGLLEKVSNPCLIMIGNEETNVAELSVVQPDLNFEAYKKGRYINFSRPVPLSFTLKGKWNTSKTNFIKSISYKDGNTTFSLECKDGLPRIFSISKI